MKALLLSFTLTGAALGSAAALAHHAFAAEFDRNQPINVTGTVTKLEWTNPHARLYIDAPGEDGETVNWNLEMGTPNLLMREGWRRDSLKAGDVVTVTGWRARNHPHVGNVGTVMLPDGKQVFAGSSIND
ncbi:MAG: DUF6152 family protein [Pseudomonadota bacterium]|nr:DUF6152 family protein [Pseudomonadota bacterium]